MYRVEPALMPYAWGSPTAIPELLGRTGDGSPVAEAWFGTHPSGPSTAVELFASDGTGGATAEGATAEGATAEPSAGSGAGSGPGAASGPESAPRTDATGAGQLRDLVASDPYRFLGEEVVRRFGPELPYLLKIIAPATPLSLQVHPSAQQAALGWVREERAGIPVDDPQRTYRDSNHKPELVLALSRFEAVSGFRTPRRALEVLAGLGTPLVEKTIERVRHGSSAQGMRSAFEYVLLGARDRDADVTEVVERIADRLAAGTSASAHSDRVALALAAAYPGDRGILASLLLNPVTLQPGEVMFVPAGCVHAYISGLAVELMANSDNVVRAGLTRKHVDARALLDIVDVRPSPPMRVAPERLDECTAVFYAPEEDFELALVTPGALGVQVGGAGPRILLGIEGEVEVTAAGGVRELITPGAAVFLSHRETALARGAGRLVRAAVP